MTRRLPPHFDPRSIPVVGVDRHLPPVGPERLSLVALRQRFLDPPTWVPEVKAEPRFTDKPMKAAAVLVTLVMHERPTLLLTQRTAHLSTHSGQVAFPGGKIDAEDSDAVAAALREAHEEVGLRLDQVEVLGQLPSYVTGSAFAVTPVVAWVGPGYDWVANPNEVAQVFEVPLDFVLNPANHRRHVWAFDGEQREWFSMPYQDGQEEHYIWGATAGMLRNFYRFMIA
jgi:8-oxo-dGTP pyrophosphatase MutT (NUDIX family)